MASAPISRTPCSSSTAANCGAARSKSTSAPAAGATTAIIATRSTTRSSCTSSPAMTAPTRAAPTAFGWTPDETSLARIDWSRFGGAVCAEALAAANPAPLRDALWRLGDLRLAGRAARFEADLTRLPPAELLYREWLEALGYSANREPMRALAERLPL